MRRNDAFSNPGSAEFAPAGMPFVSPVFPEANSVSLVFNIDAKYAPYFSVTLQSILESASPQHNYDLVVLHAGLAQPHRDRLEWQVAGLSNFSLRFFEMTDIAGRFGVDNWYSFPLSAAAYFRLFIPLVMRGYAKVIYLDSDLLIRADLAELAAIELGSDLLAGVRDFGDKHLAAGSFERGGELVEKRAYMRDDLGISNPADYINSGVLVLNVAALNREDVLPEFVALAARGCLQHDQDVLNSVCRGRILHLPEIWNAQWHVLFRPGASSMPQPEVEAILRAAKIIHYIVIRPHQAPPNEFSLPWLELAAKTPYAAEFAGPGKS